jgi:predicted ThiF/HesA family dinucleotide-utilizing enzyme
MNWLKKLFGGGKGKSGPAVVATVRREPGNVYVLRIGGMLNKATVDRIQEFAAQDIARGVKGIKLLLILENFSGWRRGDDWGDLDFFSRHEADIARIAVVGDARWKDETLMFLAAGHRSGEVQFFTTGQEPRARAWLAG